MKKSINELSCPNEGKIFDYFSGNFESVFIALSPFIVPSEISIELFYPETYPDKNTIIRKCKSMTWCNFCKISKIRDINKLDIGLRSRIGGLKKEYSSEKLVNKIEHVRNIVPPTEGIFSPYVENKILSFLKLHSNDSLKIRSEHLDSIKTIKIDELIDNEIIPYAGSILTQDESFYATTHWDSHYSIICSSKKVLTQLISKYNLEGFYCNNDTEVYWSLEKAKNLTKVST